MSNQAYKVIQDTSIPKALFKTGETANGDELFETEGINYPAGSYVLAEDITPPLRKKAEDGGLDHLLEPVSREEATAFLYGEERGTFAPEHSVEHEALVNAGHRIVDRETVLKLRSAGAEDARAAQEAAKEGGRDERSNLSLTETPNPGSEDVSSARVASASDEQYVSEEEALESEVQVTPSGVKAVNPFVEKGASGSGTSSAKSRSRRKKADAESEGSGEE